MTFRFIEKQYKHNNCDKLNKELDEFLSDLTFQSEGLSENFMDIVLDHSKQKEREWGELYDNPVDWFESVLIKNQREVLDSVINRLGNIVFTEKPKLTPRMRSKDAREWLIDEVRPLILNGMTKRIDIAQNFDISEKTVSHRVEIIYDCTWKEYVEKVQLRRY